MKGIAQEGRQRGEAQNREDGLEPAWPAPTVGWVAGTGQPTHLGQLRGTPAPGASQQ